jgi:hypothetical protein
VINIYRALAAGAGRTAREQHYDAGAPADVYPPTGFIRPVIDGS